MLHIMNGLRISPAGVLAVAIAMAASSSGAEDGRRQLEQDAIRAALQRGEVLPLARILALVQQAVPGDVIMVELERRHEVLIYEIKVLTESGRVREIEIDARTGAVMQIEDD
jgi:uncharacterized membrane protein YkoI